MEQEIVITKPKAEDIRGIQEVFYKTWLNTYPNETLGITKDDIEDRFKNAFSDTVLKARAEAIAAIKNGAMFIAKEGNKVVGLSRVEVNDRENRIRNYYVLPEYQRKGIGRKLWQEMRKVFDPEKDIYVNVASYNTQAIEFYKKLGFVDTGRRWTDEKLRMKSGNIIPEMEMVIKNPHNFIIC